MGKARILVVEDNKTIAGLIKTVLTQEGYCVDEIVPTGEEAVNSVLEKHPDLVLMNIKLQGKIDGIRACEQIRKYANVPVLFVSAFTDTETMTDAMQNNPIAYVTKPFRIKHLLGKVEKALQSHE